MIWGGLIIKIEGLITQRRYYLFLNTFKGRTSSINLKNFKLNKRGKLFRRRHLAAYSKNSSSFKMVGSSNRNLHFT